MRRRLIVVIIGVLALIPASSAGNRKILIDLSHNERIPQRPVGSYQQQQEALGKGLASMDNGEELIYAEIPSGRETFGQSGLIVAGTGIALTLMIGFAVLKKGKEPKEVFDLESEKSKLDEMLVKGLISEKEYRIAREELKIQKRKMEEEENDIT